MPTDSGFTILLLLALIGGTDAACTCDRFAIEQNADFIGGDLTLCTGNLHEIGSQSSVEAVRFASYI